MTTRSDRMLLEDVNGYDVLGARRNAQGETVYITRPGDMPRLGWLRRGEHEGRPWTTATPGSRMIGAATALLFLLGAGLLGVSLAAQYGWLLGQRHHERLPSLVEAVSLDIGMIIFSLLALGLARASKQARAERALIVACALGSATMNYAAANDGSLRSVLAYVVPPLFLAVVTDRVISVVRRYYLGDDETSAWSVLATVVLYALRAVVALPSTAAGGRRALLVATPLPEAAEKPRVIEPPKRPGPRSPRRTGSMTARFLGLVAERYGDFAQIDPARVSPICTELAPEVGIDPGNARTALRKAVLAAQAGGAK